MPERLVQHKHCLTCGRAISAREEYCSEECEAERISTLRKKKKQLLILYIGSVIVLLLAVIFAMVRF